MRAHYDEQGLDHPAEFWPPDIPPGAEIYLTAINLLSADRPVTLGFGAVLTGQIPFTAICAFADRYGVDGAAFERFVRVLRKLDAAVVSDINEKANRKS